MVSRFAVLTMLIGCGGAREQAGTCMVGDTRACDCLDGDSGFARCFDAAPAIWGSCVCASQVTAVALAPATVSHKQPVTLDGTGSTDATLLPLTYAWTLVAPPGSTAQLGSATSPVVSFVADLVGTYQATLVVDDGLATATATATIVATDDPPVIPALADRAIETGATTTLDLGSASDPDGDPLVAFSWQVLTRPAGSVAEPASPTAQVTTFTPDVDGDYGLIATVDDGIQTTSATLSVHSYRHVAPFTALPPIDVQYSAALDRVVVLDQTSLQILDPATGTGPKLSLTGKRLSISPDGKTAAIAMTSAIAIVDLANATSSSLPLAFDPSDAIVGGTGYVYSWVAGNGQRATHNVALATGADTVSTDNQVLSSSRGRLAPGGASLVISDDFLSHTLTRLDVSSGVAAFGESAAMATTACLPVWFVSASELVSACGSWYQISPFAPLATYPFGLLGAAPSGGNVLVIKSDDDIELRTLVNRVLSADATPLPHFLPSDEIGHGSYVFTGPAGVRVVIHGATAWGIVRY